MNEFESEFHWFRLQKWIIIFGQKFKNFDHSVFVLRENCCSQKGVKNKVHFFGYNSVNFGPRDNIEYPWNPCEIYDQMSSSEAPNTKKITNVRRHFWLIFSNHCEVFLTSESPQRVVTIGMHILQPFQIIFSTST